MGSSQPRRLVLLWVALAATPLFAAHAKPAAHPAITVFAAASLTNVLGELAADFTRETGTPVTLSFAASSALARQIEAGARVDAFVSADQEWMDYLAERRLIMPASRRDIAGNARVLIAPADSEVALAVAPDFPLARALGDSRLAVADPATVPAGRCAKAALSKRGVWDSVAGKLANADNVRAALAFVARGEAPLGIVYPAAVPVGGQPAGAAFLDFLGRPASQAVFARYGFTTAVAR